MLPSELLHYPAAQIFIRRVLRDVPANFSYKIDIQDELCDHLLCAVEDAEAKGDEREQAVKTAVHAMGRPALVAEHYHAIYREKTDYKKYALLHFLADWGPVLVYALLFLVWLSDHGEAMRRLGGMCFAVPAVIVCLLCGLNYPKWQTVVSAVFAPVPLMLVIGLLTRIVDGEAVPVSLLLGNELVLGWCLPAAVAMGLSCLGSLCSGRKRLVLGAVIMGIVLSGGVFCLHRADLNGRTAQDTFYLNLKTLDVLLERAQQGETPDEAVLLSTAQALDVYFDRMEARTVIGRRSTSEEGLLAEHLLFRLQCLLLDFPEIPEDAKDALYTRLRQIIGDFLPENMGYTYYHFIASDDYIAGYDPEGKAEQQAYEALSGTAFFGTRVSAKEVRDLRYALCDCILEVTIGEWASYEILIS